jgi:hypothetical protein
LEYVKYIWRGHVKEGRGVRRRVGKGYRNEGRRRGVVGRRVWGDAGKRVKKGYRNEGLRGGVVGRRVWG